MSAVRDAMWRLRPMIARKSTWLFSGGVLVGGWVFEVGAGGRRRLSGH